VELAVGDDFEAAAQDERAGLGGRLGDGAARVAAVGGGDGDPQVEAVEAGEQRGDRGDEAALVAGHAAGVVDHEQDVDGGHGRRGLAGGAGVGPGRARRVDGARGGRRLLVDACAGEVDAPELAGGGEGGDEREDEG
jgi:hypothetical protein